jgi:hypothetical protein
LVLWTLHNYEKNHLWPFEARADFSVSLTSHVSEPPGGPGSGGSPPSLTLKIFMSCLWQ